MVTQLHIPLTAAFFVAFILAVLLPVAHLSDVNALA